ncbi:PREDICTED: uncharacterized protein LOC106742124 [Dinoponera quadriceps]|uniref:Uncharacterized protein LOC106742124 n=1 Tax=Dinoponera quadriceps TaxID=609295 RepID=A0A6P3WWJ5_DINQU|nr:PREDICTED: uncharacterized protein LOC106742124 [Dinoponera quadriceps]
MYIIFILLIVTNGLVADEPQSKIQGLKLCKRNEEFLNTCIQSSIESIKPHLAKGYPADKLPPFEPYRMDVFEISNDDFNERERFMEISISGLTNYNISQFNMSSRDLEQMNFVAYFPRITMSAIYDTNSRSTDTPTENSRQPMIGEFNGVRAVIRIDNERIIKIPKIGTTVTYLRVKTVLVKLSIQHFVTYVGDQKKNYRIAETINNIVFRRWRARIDEIMFHIERHASKLIKDAASSIFDDFSMFLLLPTHHP